MRKFLAILKDSLGFFAAPAEFLGILRDSLRFFGILWDSLRFFVILWDSLGFFAPRSHPPGHHKCSNWRPRAQSLHLWRPWMATPSAADGTTTSAAIDGPGPSRCTCGAPGGRAAREAPEAALAEAPGGRLAPEAALARPRGLVNYSPTSTPGNLGDRGPWRNPLSPSAPLRLRRWLRVKVSGQGPPKPSPAAEAQRSLNRVLSVSFGPNAPLRLRRWLRVKVSGQGLLAASLRLC